MDCLLATLLTCLNWSGLYIDSGLSYQDNGYLVQDRYHSSYTIERGDLIQSGSSDWLGARHIVNQSPYGRLSIGYEIRLPSLTWRLEASHVSSLATNADRGVNALSISARWYPFR